MEGFNRSQGYGVVKMAGTTAHKGKGALKTAIGWPGSVGIAQVPFARHHGGITSIFKPFRHGGNPIGQPHLITGAGDGAFVPPHATHASLLVGVAGHQHRARWCRHWRSIILAHTYTLFRQSLQVGRGDLTAKWADIGVTHIIRNNDQHVRPLTVCRMNHAR